MNAIVVSTILVASAAAAPAGELSDDYEYSDIEHKLDDAQETLVEASTYSCQHDTAQAALAPSEARFDRLKIEAESVLGRSLNLSIWTSACRKTGDSPQFRALLRKADRQLEKAARLISRGQHR